MTITRLVAQPAQSRLKASVDTILVACCNGQIDFRQGVQVFGVFILQPLDAPLGPPGNQGRRNGQDNLKHGYSFSLAAPRLTA